MVFWRHDQHLNPEGHAVVADLLYDALLEAAKEGQTSTGEFGSRAKLQFAGSLNCPGTSLVDQG